MYSFGSMSILYDSNKLKALWWQEFFQYFTVTRASLVAQRLKSVCQGCGRPGVRSLDQEDSLEKEMATHSSTLAWRIPWREEPGRLQSMGSQNWPRLSNFTFSLLLQLQHLTHSLAQGRSSVNALWASDVMGSFPSSLALMPSWRDNKLVLLSSSGLSSTSQTPL